MTGVLDPFRTAVPFLGQATQISSRLFRKRGCGSNPKSSERQSGFEKWRFLYTWAMGWFIHRDALVFAEVSFRVTYEAPQVRSLRNIRVKPLSQNAWSVKNALRENQDCSWHIIGARSRFIMCAFVLRFFYPFTSKPTPSHSPCRFLIQREIKSSSCGHEPPYRDAIYMLPHKTHHAE